MGRQDEGPQGDCFVLAQYLESCGSPNTGIVYDIRRKTSHKYHYAIRQLKRHKEWREADNLASSLNDKNVSSFWNSVKKINSASNRIASNVDGVNGDDNIVSVFADKYEALYNMVSYNVEDMTALRN